MYNFPKAPITTLCFANEGPWHVKWTEYGQLTSIQKVTLDAQTNKWIWRLVGMNGLREWQHYLVLICSKLKGETFVAAAGATY